MIESTKTGTWYYGHSENLKRRIIEHNSGNTKSTRSKGPWKLIFKRPFLRKLEAARFELKLKKLKNKTFIQKSFSEYFIGV
ncbi:MAG: GIY-YIG nuclease family protein [Cyclobacteriaceae bacterium]|nr:GIY-YIG nuclease family protein [Cyclobacteriaceae bacterium]